MHSTCHVFCCWGNALLFLVCSPTSFTFHYTHVMVCRLCSILTTKRAFAQFTVHNFQSHQAVVLATTGCLVLGVLEFLCGLHYIAYMTGPRQGAGRSDTTRPLARRNPSGLISKSCFARCRTGNVIPHMRWE